MNTMRIYLLSFLAVFMLSCENNKEEILDPKVEEEIADVSFATEVKPIFDGECVGCHNNFSASAGYNFEGYSNVLKHVSDPALLNAIKHESTSSPMPKGGAKLSTTKIKTIEEWIKEGAKDN